MKTTDYLLPSRAFHMQITGIGAGTEVETEVNLAQLCDEDEAIAIYAIQYVGEYNILENATSMEICLKAEFERAGAGVYINGAPAMSNHIIHGIRIDRNSTGHLTVPEQFYYFEKPILVASNIRGSSIKWGGASLPLNLVKFWYKRIKATALERRYIRGLYG